MQQDWNSNLPDYLKHYLSLATENSVLESLIASLKEFTSVIDLVEEDRANFAYAKGKWTIKELLQHCIDTERIFQYRSLCLARGEKQNLPGFDENEYAAAVDVSKRSLQSLIEEFNAVRQSTVLLFSHLSEKQLNTEGFANGMKIRPIDYGFLCAGHLRHHLNVLKERYLL